MCMYIHMYVYTNLVFAATRLLIQLCPPQDNLDSWVDLHIRGPREFFHLHSQSWGHVHNGEVACTFLHVEVYGINVILCLCLMFDTINLCAVPFKQDVRNWRSYCVPHNSGLTFIKVEEHTEEKRKWPHFSRFCRIASPCFFLQYACIDRCRKSHKRLLGVWHKYIVFWQLITFVTSCVVSDIALHHAPCSDRCSFWPALAGILAQQIVVLVQLDGPWRWELDSTELNRTQVLLSWALGHAMPNFFQMSWKMPCDFEKIGAMWGPQDMFVGLDSPQ
jgi:hypothetical protein